MRWSISTKIFLGFAAVIIAFGSVGIYANYQMHDMRRNVQRVRKGVLPLNVELSALLRDLKVYEEEMGRSSRRDLVRLRSYFPSFKPFEGLLRVQRRFAAVKDAYDDDPVEQAELNELAARVGRLRAGSELWTALRSVPSPDVQRLLTETSVRSNVEVYDALARAFVALLHEEQLRRARALQDELASYFRRMRNEVSDVRREARKFLARAERNAERAESRSLLVIGIASGLALVAALIVMGWAALTLRPMRQLREAARRVARGDYTAVSIHTTDEIGQLAVEFNRMAASLAERDQQLAQQREELLRAERLAIIGKMSSQITHEIRNPLSSIGLNTELLEDELADLAGETSSEPLEEARALLTAIRGEIDRLTDVTEQYLRFARLPKPALQPEDVNGLLADLAAFVDSELTAQGIALELKLDEDLPLLDIDDSQIRQAMLNLLRNAAQAMSGGGTITLGTEAKGDGSAVIWVRDDGQGIEAEVLAKIFDPFFSTKSQGTGLGLPLVQQIAHEHGGSVTCESVVGSGTEFAIHLPPARPQVVAEAPPPIDHAVTNR